MPGKGAFVVAHSLPAAALAKLCKQCSAQRRHAGHNGDDRGNLRVCNDQTAHLCDQPACALRKRAKAAHAPGKVCNIRARVEGKAAHAGANGVQHAHDIAADIGNVDAKLLEYLIQPVYACGNAVCICFDSVGHDLLKSVERFAQTAAGISLVDGFQRLVCPVGQDFALLL